jgi:hypothetical protein
MIATTHMLVGAVGALKARSIPGAVAIGALTHLLLDAVPHRDYRRRTLGGLALPADLVVGAVAAWGLSDGSRPAVAGAIGGVLPDVLRVAEQATGVDVTRWAHDTTHTDSRPSAWGSAAIQGLTSVTAALALSWLSRRSSRACRSL